MTVVASQHAAKKIFSHFVKPWMKTLGDEEWVVRSSSSVEAGPFVSIYLIMAACRCLKRHFEDSNVSSMF